MSKKISLSVVFILAFFVLAAEAGFVNVPPSSFRSQTDAGNELYLYSYDYCRYVYKATSAGTLYAPVYLPDGAVIKNIRVIYYDNDPTYDLVVSLDRVNMYTSTAEVVLDVGSSGASGSIQSLIDSSVGGAHPYELRTVKDAACQYYIYAIFHNYGDNLRIYGVVIEYQ